MKKLMFIFVALVSMLISMMFIMVNSAMSIITEKSIEKYDKNYIIYDYMITNIQGDEYYGDSIVNDTRIYFTNAEVVKDQDIQIGDNVEVWFENDRVDGIVKVVKK